jgi:hypothetical protein
MTLAEGSTCRERPPNWRKPKTQTRRQAAFLRPFPFALAEVLLDFVGPDLWSMLSLRTEVRSRTLVGRFFLGGGGADLPPLSIFSSIIFSRALFWVPSGSHTFDQFLSHPHFGFPDRFRGRRFEFRRIEEFLREMHQLQYKALLLWLDRGQMLACTDYDCGYRDFSRFGQSIPQKDIRFISTFPHFEIVGICRKGAGRYHRS